MKILGRYCIKEFLKCFGLFEVTFVAIFLLIDFIQKIDNFVEANAPQDAVFTYFLFKSPYIIINMVPVATLLAVIVMLCLMEKNNEITAMKACGVSVFEFTKPVFFSPSCT